jgi:hypothetical protein
MKNNIEDCRLLDKLWARQRYAEAEEAVIDKGAIRSLMN